MLKDLDTTPKRGDIDVVTADEIGWDRTNELAKEWKSARADFVKAVLGKSTSPQAIMARQWRAHPTKPGFVLPYTIATTATGCTKAGDAVAATHMVNIRPTALLTAMFLGNSSQADTIRFGVNAMSLNKGEADPVFAAVGPAHLVEVSEFRRARFEETNETKVASSVLKAIPEWTRGKETIYMVLPSMEAKRAAADMRAKLARFEDLEGQILDDQAKGIEADPRVLRKYNELRIGLDVYWFFLGVQSKVAIEREPTIEAIKAAGNAGLISR